MKSNIKRIGAALLIFALAIMGLTACSGGSSNDSSNDSSGTYKIINISDDKEFIEEMPTEAKPGDTVTVKIMTVTDAVSYVRVNEDPDFGKFVDANTYVFVMPEGDVSVKAGFTTNTESTTAQGGGTESGGSSAGSNGTEGGGSSSSSGTSGGSATTGTSNHQSGSLVTGGSYNILDNLWENMSNDITYLYGNDFLLIMPNTDDWAYEQKEANSFTIFYKPARASGYDGNLVTITAYDMDDNSFSNHPHWQAAGIGGNTNKRFIATYPTDVQWDGSDPSQTEGYKNLSDYLNKIGEGAVNSPFQTADSNPAP